MGVKLVVYSDLDLKFEEITRQMQVICLPKNDKLESLTSGDVTDVALNFDYLRDGKKVALRVGPMSKEQGISYLKNAGSIDKVFPPPDKSSQFIDFTESIPESFLYFDVDTSTKESHSVDAWIDFANDTIKYELDLFEGLKKLVLECD
jgi:hypothetical protein